MHRGDEYETSQGFLDKALVTNTSTRHPTSGGLAGFAERSTTTRFWLLGKFGYYSTVLQATVNSLMLVLELTSRTNYGITLAQPTSNTHL